MKSLLNILTNRAAVAAIFAAAGAVGMTSTEAEAGWLTWAGIGTTAAGVGASTSGGPVVGAVLGTVEITAIAVDALITPPPAPVPPPAPANSAGNAPVAITPEAAGQLLPAGPKQRPWHGPLEPEQELWPMLPPFPHCNPDPIAHAGDEYMDAIEGLIGAIYGGADQAPHLNNVAGKLDGLADLLSAAIGDYLLTQGDLDALQSAYTMHDQLPAFEVQTLRSWGVGEGAIGNYLLHHKNTRVELAPGSNFSLVDGLRDMADEYRHLSSLPAPGTAALLAIGGVLAARRRR